TRQDNLALKGPSLSLLGLRLYLLLQVMIVQKTKKMRSMSLLPVSYVVPQGP
ncbi:hypothetical protein ATANTOWER_001617, partial [Ataeniobius toweri]|nr:hypothetical protein [Ataeniobius toweri]